MVEPAPLNDDAYALAPEDYDLPPQDFGLAPEGDYIVGPPSPKSPRLMVDENAVPEFNRSVPEFNRSAPGTPTKRSRADSITSMPLGEETLHALSRWQRAFVSVDSHASFDKLIAEPARRKQAADAFLQLLVLHTKDLVRAEQLAPYGNIVVQPTEKLFLATPEAISLY